MPERNIGNAESRDKTRDGGEPLSRGKQWFFGIGISEYDDFPNLVNAVKDVEDLNELLIDDYGFLPEHSITLTNKQATKDNMIDELDGLVKQVGAEDSCLVYFAGHGHMMLETQRGFWIPVDGKRNSTSKYLRNSTIRDYLADIHSKHTLLIADSCFSGSLFVRGASRSSTALHELESIPSRWAICSGRHDEEVSDGNPGENSPFAQSILETLRGNTNKLFNVGKLVDRVVEQTRSNYEQLPEGSPVRNVGHKGGQYIFHRLAKEEKFWEDCQQKDSVRIYSQYLGQFADGKYRSEALARIKELEDERAWRLAEKSDTISALHTYVARFRDGKYIEAAKEKISTLEKLENHLVKNERHVVKGEDLERFDNLNAGVVKSGLSRFVNRKALGLILGVFLSVLVIWQTYSKLTVSDVKKGSEVATSGSVDAIGANLQGSQLAVSDVREGSEVGIGGAARVVELYEKACLSGDMNGCGNLGLAYFHGLGVKMDFVRAAELLEKACQGGDMNGCGNLGLAYFHGKGVTKDLVQAAEFLEKACQGGDMSGCGNLGLAYFHGIGVKMDLVRAAELYEKACQGGDMPGCGNLGLAYFQGIGVTKDLVRAAELYEKACQGGYMPGCGNLGFAYFHGMGVTKDLVRAAELYEKACQGGDPTACTLLDTTH